jgi:SOS-response transcriptional repressor LexA
MSPIYQKNDKIYFKKQENYKNGDDVIIAVKNNILSVRRLYRYPKGIILQAINSRYPTINVNIISNDMILGKITSIYREIK